MLVHYDPALPLKLDCDASAYGVGAVLSYVFPNGEERPVAYASRTLTETEKGYARIEKEALSLVYGIKKYHQYLYLFHNHFLGVHIDLMARQRWIWEEYIRLEQ